jgi:prepilin-type N-terminal cleavage/methylation domain-containing protein
VIVLKKYSGFTLIEIIIVIVILGVLATLALPRLTAQTRAAEAAEAMYFFGALKRAMIACAEESGDVSLCGSSSTENGVTKPNPSKFFYSVRSVASSPYVITARRTANTVEFLSMSIDNATLITTFDASSNGPFVGIVAKTGNTSVIVPAASTAIYN